MVAYFNHTFYDAPRVVFRPAQFIAGSDNGDHFRMSNAANARLIRDESIAAMRAVFGHRLIVWDVFALSEAREHRVVFNHSCFNTHVPSEVVDAEVQLLLWQLAQINLQT